MQADPCCSRRDAEDAGDFGGRELIPRRQLQNFTIGNGQRLHRTGDAKVRVMPVAHLVGVVGRDSSEGGRAVEKPCLAARSTALVQEQIAGCAQQPRHVDAAPLRPSTPGHGEDLGDDVVDIGRLRPADDVGPHSCVAAAVEVVEPSDVRLGGPHPWRFPPTACPLQDLLAGTTPTARRLVAASRGAGRRIPGYDVSVTDPLLRERRRQRCRRRAEGIVQRDRLTEGPAADALREARLREGRASHREASGEAAVSDPGRRFLTFGSAAGPTTVGDGPACL